MEKLDNIGLVCGDITCFLEGYHLILICSSSNLQVMVAFKNLKSHFINFIGIHSLQSHDYRFFADINSLDKAYQEFIPVVLYSKFILRNRFLLNPLIWMVRIKTAASGVVVL